MCGIAGVWGAEDRDGVLAMMGRLRHRGPDAAGTHSGPGGPATLGHTRLSIVDVAGGDQPLDDGSGDVLVANGEIYNADQLRDRFGRSAFRTASDSEAILHVIAREGPAGAADLRGMFAFAVLVGGEELVLGRDPLGIKPLYVGRSAAGAVFASELKALPPSVRDVAPLAPGTVWSSSTGSARFCELPDPDPAPGGFAHHAGRVRTALDGAIRRRLMSDVPVGAFLSGGLDSSAIVALMRPHVEELHTFSVGLPGSPDLAAARLVAAHLGTVHHEYELDPEEIAEAVPEIVWSLESFDQDLVRSAVPTYFTARLASRHVKVVLTGEGADELFAGYRYHRGIGDPTELQREARRSLGALHEVNLQRVDRATMAHSVEARVPFLDLGLIETALSIPAGLRAPGPEGGEKALLRAAVADLLPDEVVRRAKAQFDEGTGASKLLPRLAEEGGGPVDLDAYRARYPETPLRSREECWYHRLLVDSFADPGPVLANVGRWTDRAA